MTRDFDGPGWLLEVDQESSGERVDRFIAKRIPRLSRNRAARLTVTVLDREDDQSGTVLKKSSRVQAGQKIWVDRPLPTEDTHTLVTPRIIAADDDFLILDKPPGWVAHPTASRYQSAITTWLKQNHHQAQPAHRLDLETSGVLICAQTPDVSSSLKELFTQRQVHKTYWAVCDVTPRGLDHLKTINDSWVEQTPLGFDPKSSVKLKMGVGHLPAQTLFTVIKRETSSTYDRLLVEANPLSGRQHQIRVHLALVGLPLVGDKLYGPSEDFFVRHLNGQLTEEDYLCLGHVRHCLHAHRISFTWQGVPRQWHSPFPNDMKMIIASCSFANLPPRP